MSAGIAAWLSVMAGAGFCTLELGLSGTTDVSVGLPAMLGVHALIGIGEALITIAALTFIWQTAPDILGAPVSSNRVSLGRRLAIGSLIAAVVATLASLFASAEPDGLEKVAGQLGFLQAGKGAPFELFPDYTIPGLDGVTSTIAAGLIGIAFVAFVLLVLGRVAQRRTRS